MSGIKMSRAGGSRLSRQSLMSPTPAIISAMDSLNKDTGKIKRITLRRMEGSGNLGFTIRGGVEHGLGHFISNVDSKSQADYHGLKIGDQILAINGLPLMGTTHKEVVGLISSRWKLEFTVKSVGLVPMKSSKSDPVTWKSVDDLSNNAPPHNVIVDTGPEIQKVILKVHEKGLGCSICKGPENSLGIFVQSVKPKGIAATHGIKPGDQILECNGRSLSSDKIEFSDAVYIIKSNKVLELVIKKGSGLDFLNSGYDSAGSTVTATTIVDEDKAKKVTEIAVVAVAKEMKKEREKLMFDQERLRMENEKLNREKIKIEQEKKTLVKTKEETEQQKYLLEQQISLYKSAPSLVKLQQEPSSMKKQPQLYHSQHNLHYDPQKNKHKNNNNPPAAPPPPPPPRKLTHPNLCPRHSNAGLTENNLNKFGPRRSYLFQQKNSMGSSEESTGSSNTALASAIQNELHRRTQRQATLRKQVTKHHETIENNKFVPNTIRNDQHDKLISEFKSVHKKIFKSSSESSLEAPPPEILDHDNLSYDSTELEFSEESSDSTAELAKVPNFCTSSSSNSSNSSSDVDVIKVKPDRNTDFHSCEDIINYNEVMRKSKLLPNPPIRSPDFNTPTMTSSSEELENYEPEIPDPDYDYDPRAWTRKQSAPNPKTRPFSVISRGRRKSQDLTELKSEKKHESDNEKKNDEKGDDDATAEKPSSPIHTRRRSIVTFNRTVFAKRHPDNRGSGSSFDSNQDIEKQELVKSPPTEPAEVPEQDHHSRFRKHHKSIPSLTVNIQSYLQKPEPEKFNFLPTPNYNKHNKVRFSVSEDASIAGVDYRALNNTGSGYIVQQELVKTLQASGLKKKANGTMSSDSDEGGFINKDDCTLTIGPPTRRLSIPDVIPPPPPPPPPPGPGSMYAMAQLIKLRKQSIDSTMSFPPETSSSLSPSNQMSD